MKYGDHVESEELRNIFCLILGFGFIEIIMIYGKSDFLNVNCINILAYCTDLLAFHLSYEFL